MTILSKQKALSGVRIGFGGGAVVSIKGGDSWGRLLRRTSLACGGFYWPLQRAEFFPKRSLCRSDAMAERQQKKSSKSNMDPVDLLLLWWRSIYETL